MGFANNKLPGEWYGPHAISLMLKDLNKMFTPVRNFEICVFNDGAIYYDKILKLATKNRSETFAKKDYPTRPER